MKQNSTKATLSRNPTGPGTQLNGATWNGGSQPPRNRMVVEALIRIMLPYSPRKKRAKVIAEYSEKYPATSSASASGRSNGVRLVSARPEMKKNTDLSNSSEGSQVGRC